MLMEISGEARSGAPFASRDKEYLKPSGSEIKKKQAELRTQKKFRYERKAE